MKCIQYCSSDKLSYHSLYNHYLKQKLLFLYILLKINYNYIFLEHWYSISPQDT